MLGLLALFRRPLDFVKEGYGTTSLGRLYRRQPRLASGRRLYAWFACFVPPALGLSEVRRRCVTLGSSCIGANRASASGRRLYAWFACFVPPALGLSEVRRRCDMLGSSYIGANRASASGLVVSSSQALGLCEVRGRYDTLGSYGLLPPLQPALGTPP